MGRRKLPIAPIFIADSVLLAVSREKDGKLHLVDSRRVLCTCRVAAGWRPILALAISWTILAMCT